MWLTCEIVPVRITLFPKNRVVHLVGKDLLRGETDRLNLAGRRTTRGHREGKKEKIERKKKTPLPPLSPPVPPIPSSEVSSSIASHCMLQLISFQWHFLESAYIIAASPEGYVASVSVLARFFMPQSLAHLSTRVSTRPPASSCIAGVLAHK